MIHIVPIEKIPEDCRYPFAHLPECNAVVVHIAQDYAIVDSAPGTSLPSKIAATNTYSRYADIPRTLHPRYVSKAPDPIEGDSVELDKAIPEVLHEWL